MTRRVSTKTIHYPSTWCKRLTTQPLIRQTLTGTWSKASQVGTTSSAKSLPLWRLWPPRHITLSNWWDSHSVVRTAPQTLTRPCFPPASYRTSRSSWIQVTWLNSSNFRSKLNSPSTKNSSRHSIRIAASRGRTFRTMPRGTRYPRETPIELTQMKGSRMIEEAPWAHRTLSIWIGAT